LFPNTGIVFADSVPIQQSTESISAQPVNTPEIPTHAAKLHDMVDRETNRHPDWVGLISWNETNAKIDYLGPADKNPYRIDQSRWAHSPPTVNNTKIEQVTVASPTTNLASGTSSLLTIYKPVNVFDSIYWRLFGGGNSIYKIEQSYTLIASTTTDVNLYHWLNAHNSNNKKWLQVSAVYDKAKFWDTTSKWYVGFDLWDMTSATNCAQDSSFPIQSSIGFTTGNTATAYIRADGTTAGKYWMGVTSGGSGASVSVTIPSDTGSTIDIGYTSNCSKAFPSATQIEEESTTSGAIYYYGQPTYTYKFYPTSTSSPTTTVYSYNGKGGYGGSVTESTNPAWVKYSCTGALTCP
jgi:hypothetical protein